MQLQSVTALWRCRSGASWQHAELLTKVTVAEPSETITTAAAATDNILDAIQLAKNGQMPAELHTNLHHQIQFRAFKF